MRSSRWAGTWSRRSRDARAAARFGWWWGYRTSSRSRSFIASSEPAFRLPEQVQVICRADQSMEGFLAEFAVHAVDLVLSDAPVGPGSSVRAFNHLLGECGRPSSPRPAWPRRAARGSLRPSTAFPSCSRAATPRSVGPSSSGSKPRGSGQDCRGVGRCGPSEGDGGGGDGCFRRARCRRRDVRQRYKVTLVGHAKDLRQRFFAISVERKIKHPAVVAICEGARRDTPPSVRLSGAVATRRFCFVTNWMARASATAKLPENIVAQNCGLERSPGQCRLAVPSNMISNE